LCGADGNLIQSHKRRHPAVDYGFVGDIDIVNTTLLKNLLEQEITVVIAPITHDKQGVLLNTNADTIAQETAQSMSEFYEVDLIYSFEKAGVLMNAEDDSTVITSINQTSYKKLTEQKIIHSGMIPKLDNAFAALNKGVKKVVIGKADQLQELIGGTTGTSINQE
jgi:acetylglutamate kinase